MIHTVPFPHLQSSDHFSSLPMSHARSNPPPPPPPPPSNKPQCTMCRRKRKRGAAAKRGRGWNLPTPRLQQHGPTTHPPGIGPSLTDPPPIPNPQPNPAHSRTDPDSIFFPAGRFRSWPGLAWYVCMCWPTTESQGTKRRSCCGSEKARFVRFRSGSGQGRFGLMRVVVQLSNSAGCVVEVSWLVICLGRGSLLLLSRDSVGSWGVVGDGPRSGSCGCGSGGFPSGFVDSIHPCPGVFRDQVLPSHFKHSR